MLNGIRIVEVEGLGPAPFAGMLLADLGAEVIVVHRKDGYTAPGVPEQSVLDRGKKSVALDLKNQDDVATFLKLVKTAHGLIEGFRPGVMERLGLGPAECHAENPALTYGRMTGWGQTGPLAHASGHDYNYIAMSGAGWYAGAPDETPMTPATLVGDIGGGAMYLAVGMLAGILNARETGHGQVVDAAIYDGSAHMMNLLMSLRQSGGMATPRGQSLLDGPHWSRCYKTSDGGHISVQCLEPKFYALFLEMMGLSDDPRFADQFDRARWPEQIAALADIFAADTRAHWSDLFLGTDACVAPVLSPDEALDTPMNAARKTWVMAGETLQAAPAPRFSDQSEWVPPRVPRRGEDDAAVLGGL